MNVFNFWWHTDSAAYDAYVNVPFGVAHYRNKVNNNIKLFVAVPRRNPGIPSTFNTVELTGNAPHLNPKLVAYPSWQHTTLSVSMSNFVKTTLNKYIQNPKAALYFVYCRVSQPFLTHLWHSKLNIEWKFSDFPYNHSYLVSR